MIAALLALLNALVSTGARAAVTVGEAPVILRVSDAIQAGKSFAINGEGLEPAAIDVAVAADATGQSPAAPPDAALHAEILQTDKDAHYAVVRMPAGSPSGIYNVWVRNAQGWSACKKMNAARPVFMSEYESFKGLDIQLVGRNFDQGEFGGATATRVRLNNGRGVTHSMSIRAVNPYCVTFTVEGQSLGEYFVEVSNDNGINWARLDNGQKLTIVAPGQDPLGLGVAWAKDFKWYNVVDVTTRGANPTDNANDTQAVQNAIDAVEKLGGGVVLLPNGNYYIDSVKLGAGVVLMGQDKYKTKLYCTSTDGRIFIGTKGDDCLGGVAQLQGIAKLSVLLADPDNTKTRPDCFMWLGDPWGPNLRNQDARKGNRLFVVGVNLNYPWTSGDSIPENKHRGMGFNSLAKERILLKDNHFAGWYADHSFAAAGRYFTSRNNYFEYSTGYGQSYASYSFFENNRFIIHPEYNQDSHGIFARSDTYAANNYIEGAGDGSNRTGGTGKHNDGEGIAADTAAGGHITFGAVTAATANSITVAPIRPLDNPAQAYGELSVMITHGRGLGQLRKVKHVDVKAKTIALDKPFEVVPDGSSKFTLITPLKNFTVYQNTIKNCAKGIWSFGKSYDHVIADNTSIDSQGVYMWSVRSNHGYDIPGYFLRVARNTITGVSRRDNFAGISIFTGRYGNRGFHDVMTYGTEIVDNSITGNNKLATGDTRTESAPYSGICVVSHGYANQSDGTGTGDATNTLIEGNRLSNLKVGITFTRCNYGQVISRNNYDDSVLRFFDDLAPASDNTLLTGNSRITGSSPAPATESSAAPEK